MFDVKEHPMDVIKFVLNNFNKIGIWSSTISHTDNVVKRNTKKPTFTCLICNT